MLKLSFAGCLGLSPLSSDFDTVHSWNVCGSHKSRKNP